MKRSTGLVIAVCGVVLLLVSYYISGQVAEGRVKISNAQEKVNMGKAIFSVTPETNEIGKGLTGGAQNKINEGSAEADMYSQWARLAKIGGIVLVIAGIGVFFFCRKKS